MGRRLVVFADGTGNAYAVRESNVWRLYQALDRKDCDQLARYIKGVGTSGFRPLALLDGATGFGVPGNIRELYRFLSYNWRPGDEIWAFGFSRGAFTIRSLIGLIDSQGLMPAEIDGRPVTRAEMKRNAMAAWRAYRASGRSWQRRWPTIAATRLLRDAILGIWHRLLRHRPYRQVLAARHPDAATPRLRFLGLFDTVEAYGVPIGLLRTAIDQAIWPLSFRNRHLSPRVEAARHALSLDDERLTFHPVLFQRRDAADAARIRELWFAGAHSDVGGGYPDDSLAGVPLGWMAEEASRAGLRFREETLAAGRTTASALGDAHESRAGLGIFYRYAPRRVRIDGPRGPEPADIHPAVLARIADGTDAYAPVALPQAALLRRDGAPAASLAGLLPQTDARGKAAGAGKRALIWWRRAAHALMAPASLGALFAPFLVGPPGGDGAYARLDGAASALLAPPILALGSLLPAPLEGWLQRLAAHPLPSLLLLLIVLGLIGWSGALRDRIAALARYGWRRAPMEQPPPPVSRLAIAIAERLCRLGQAAWTQRLAGEVVLPAGLLGGLLLGGLVLLHPVGLALRTELGSLCPASARVTPLAAGESLAREGFTAGDPCWASGIGLAAGARYHIEIAPGIPRPEAETGRFLPWRRWWSAGWGQPIGRVGRGSRAEWVLQPLPDAASSDATPVAPGVFVARFTAPQAGEFHLFLNGMLPFGFDLGPGRAGSGATARVTLRRLP
ncbi:T6SS phospholipase effector Tle1-like catalytic domain-containing protein [Roseicella frigidaeris]|uniref:DUF2235 domain-containing protein n=1 Tax=Roseicella frigidaeris TaxID=2230885 RepID=A0A327M966_9PROT|nr:DUF2235 domain-containing protein [Roseicella frigidaeris]RAI58945.1 DUF2235 domain-containing protein [Roseicella frigidaeris]